MQPLVHGVYSALFTPRHPDGSLNRDVLRAGAEFVRNAGVDGLVMNGATAEYALSREGEFEQILHIVREVAGEGHFVAGIGSTDLATTIRHGRAAMEAGAKALLLPAPMFFRYAQQDVEAYALHVAKAVDAPVLLYNLPQFANGFEGETVVRLIQSGAGIVGIKDSCGTLDILRMLTARGDEGVSRIVGNDVVFAQARREGVCDGVISGVAAALPELLVFLGNADLGAESEAFEAAAALLDELIVQLAPFPTPWGLKFIADHRGLGPLGSALPITPSRQAQANLLAGWLEEWWTRLAAVVPVGSLVVPDCVS
jgi:4-hydroxy-tetrahydrodipicolinate synthase